MKSSVKIEKKEQTEIDWGKAQILVYASECMDFVIISNGDHNGDFFQEQY